MKKCMQWVLSVCCLYSGFLGASKESEALKALLQPMNSMQATFKQTVINEKGKVLQKTEGALWIQKPRQFRWEIQGNEARLMVSNGKKVWDYDEDLAQVSIRTLDKNTEKLPIFFLSGNVDTLDQDFEVKQCTAKQDACFELIPKKSSTATDKDETADIFQRMQLKFTKHVLVELETWDPLGQRTVFSFMNVKINEQIPAQRFQFIPPKGVDVIGAS